MDLTPESEVADMLRQHIRFCPAADGGRLACATLGAGRPPVKAANWLTHIEYDLHNPIWRPGGPSCGRFMLDPERFRDIFGVASDPGVPVLFPQYLPRIRRLAPTRYRPTPRHQAQLCPECDGPLARASGCVSCPSCGWGKCG